MERLTTRNDMGIAVLKQPYRCERCGEETWSLSDHGNREPIDKLAEYEDLEEQGKLLKLPFRARSKIYTIYSDEDSSFIEEAKVVEVSTHRVWIDSAYFDYDDFGKTVFLSREEAEAALRKQENRIN